MIFMLSQRHPARTSSIRAVISLLGILLVPAAGYAQGNPPRRALSADLRIGSLDDPAYGLSQVGAMTVDGQGRIYVAQPVENSIRVYDARGKFVRIIGRRGSGPGEFQRLGRIGWKADTLWAVDLALKRVSLFGGTGQHRKTFSVESPVVDGAAYPTGPSGLLADGSVAGQPVPSSARVSKGTVSRMPLLRMDRNGRVLGRFALLDVRGDFGVIRGRMVANFTLPVQTHTLWSLAPDGSSLVVVDRPVARTGERSTFRVVKVGPSGTTVFARNYTYTPRKIPESVRDSLEGELAEMFVKLRLGRTTASTRRLVRDSVPIPEYQPPVSHVVVGRDGTVWLRREALGVPQTQWLVLSPGGDILADLQAPSGLQIFQAQKDMVWGVERDDLDVPYVVRYRVRPST